MRRILVIGMLTLSSAAWAQGTPAQEATTKVAVTETAPPEAAAPVQSIQPADGKAGYRAILRKKAAAAGVPFELADAVAEVESGYDRGAVGGVGEVGLMQLLPSTARMLGFSGPTKDLFEPETNIHYGVTYLAQAWRLSGNDVCTTVMKYRAGHGESRFSHRSVDYCIRVRRGLAARGYAVTGEVPKATFGEPVGGGTRVAGKIRKKSRLNWTAADARWRKVTGQINSASLMIMQ
ncbi:soluble lytic murein transglycosylase-like protein [Pseudochelatococcus lubricantis]|uniref:Soluble lytic murein transglycosylase-like protein n=1 Tax=Pseudochelatococcus lubricantis TaxID=1538102 RepID=A0ABX0V0B9_9HYPH|nr:transglycosylase SLT domain-containing protein [Pseudochelatococcus lubricantis]NIJ58621.1 soluble lytic murein transglycosylase-like protein [Pseudochelatococcus lubricantis]